MQKVQGFGGFFFRASDSAKLAEWYQTHLGIDPVPTSAETAPWMAQGGATVFAPFAKDTDYFPAGKSFMLNFRVDDLDAMVAQLRDANIEVRLQPDTPGIGRFAQLSGPEGTPIELWQPA